MFKKINKTQQVFRIKISSKYCWSSSHRSVILLGFECGGFDSTISDYFKLSSEYKNVYYGDKEWLDETIEKYKNIQSPSFGPADELIIQSYDPYSSYDKKTRKWKRAWVKYEKLLIIDELNTL